MISRSSKTEPGGDAPPAATWVTVGRMLRPHGVRGEVVVEPLTDVAGRFAPGGELRLAPGEPGGEAQTLRVVASRRHGDRLLVRFAGVEGRDAAEALPRGDLEVPAAAVPAAPAGSYYYYELVGCRCRDRSLGALGRVVALVEDGGGLLLRVERGEREILVPFVAEFVEGIDVEAREIRLVLPAGLAE